jgi:hypothetical protein
MFLSLEMGRWCSFSLLLKYGAQVGWFDLMKRFLNGAHPYFFNLLRLLVKLEEASIL